MSKLRCQLHRQMLIIQYLKEAYQPLKSDEIYDRLSRDCLKRDIPYPSTPKAREVLLTRDKNTIADLFGIEIEYKRPWGYTIAECVDTGVSFDKLFEDFDLLSSLHPDSKVNKYIFAEHHRGKGTLYLGDLLYAIKSAYFVKFDYKLVRHKKTRSYIIAPCFLKENQARWYLGGMDGERNKLFALDRITKLEILEEKKFKRPELNIEHLWQDCFGIWDDPSLPVEEIVLRYSPLDGEFLRGVPLHHTQQILSDTDEEFVIAVKLRITNDFVMALLARSKSVEVIKPEHLRRQIYEISTACAERNK